MDSADVLAVMPQHFTTAEYARTAGVTLSSASRALRRLPSAALLKTGQGRWAKSPDGVSGSLTEQSDLVRLEGFYGDAPRRISHAQALLYAGIPIVCGLTVSSPVRVSPKAASRWHILHRRESDATLRKHAEQLDPRTWLSLPCRAVAEYAQTMPSVVSDEILQRILYCFPETLTLEEVARCAADMGWSAGLRRLASLVAAAARIDPEVLPEDWEKFLDDVGGVSRGDKWISLNPVEAKIYPGVSAWSDQERKVFWQTHPEDLYEHILY